jgi:hypothetical protein
MSDWLDILRAEVARTSQARVVRALKDATGNGYPSPTVISQVLSENYPGSTERLAAIVLGLWGHATVDCPVLGEIGTDACQRHQHAKFSTANPQRVTMYRACRAGCPHSRLEDDR